MRRSTGLVLISLVVAALVVLIVLDRSGERREIASHAVEPSTWTKIYTVCEGEGREYIHSELWQGGKKLDRMTPLDLADLGPDHQIKVRIVPPRGLEPKNFSRDSDVLIKEGDSFIGELDCKYRMRFSGPFYDGFRVFDVSNSEVAGCIYGDGSTYNERSRTTDSKYCQVFLPGPGKYRVAMVNGHDCFHRCATNSQTFEVTEQAPRVNLSIAPP